MYQAVITYRHTDERIGTYHEIKTGVYEDPEDAKLEAMKLVHQYYIGIYVIAVEINYYEYKETVELKGVEKWN